MSLSTNNNFSSSFTGLTVGNLTLTGNINGNTYNSLNGQIQIHPEI